jgi:tRNA(adenine34) deaminase
MRAALAQAARAASRGEVPVGAIIIDSNGKVVSRAYNVREANHDATGHAEIRAIRKATQKLKTWRLNGCSLYVTLEPCLMCLGALGQARLKETIFGACDKSGPKFSEN